MDSLRIALWNANGLTQHKYELEIFLKQHKIDVLLVSETHFTNRSYFNIYKYKTYFTNHPDGSAHGGTAILIKDKLRHYEIEKYEKDYLQATNIKIKQANGALVVAAVYCPPKHSIKKYHFEEYFKTLGEKFIAGGDFNSKHPRWGSRLTNPKGRQLQLAMADKGYQHISTGKPTYWPTDSAKIPDLLDFFITKGLSSNYIQVEECFDLSSDHSPIIATVSTTIISEVQKPTLSNKKTDWERFRNYLTNANYKMFLNCDDDIDSAVEQVTNNIQYAAWNSTPVIMHKDTVTNYPKHILDKITEKRKARRKWNFTRHPSDKKVLNKLSKKLKELLYSVNNDAFQNRISNLSPNADGNYSLWRTTKKLKRPTEASSPLRKETGTWARSEEDKAETLAKHLAETFKPNQSQVSQEEENILTSFLDVPLQLSPPIKHFTANEVSEEIKFLNSRKAPGYDLITASILKQLPRKTIVAITQIFNAIIRLQYFPVQWKYAQVIMIPKPGKPAHDVASYRPISLLPTLSKLLEKLLLKRLKPIIEENNLIPPHQFGFRNQHSTIEQIHRVVRVIENSFEEKKCCSAAFLDIRQAFDRVWHTGLLYKIKCMLPHQYFLLFKSYVNDRYFQVIYGMSSSKNYKINAGVPQGSVFGPVLYQLYTADLPTLENVTTATFADDTAYLAAHQDPVEASELLQQILNITQRWADKWRIKINETKSAQITFTTKQDTCPVVFLNNTALPVKNEVTYLGMHLDRRLTWKKHLATKRKQLDLKVKKMYWLIGRKSQLSLNNKILLYKTIIVPIWTYGIQMWGCAKQTNINLIQRFQSKTLRIIANAPWYVSNETLHTDLGITYVEEQIKIYATKYEKRLDYHPNELALNLLYNENQTRRLNRKKPLELV